MNNQISQLDVSVKLSPNEMLDTYRQFFFFSLPYYYFHFSISHFSAKVNYKSSAQFGMHCVAVWLMLACSDLYSGLLTLAFIGCSTMKITRYHKQQMLGRRTDMRLITSVCYILYESLACSCSSAMPPSPP